MEVYVHQPLNQEISSIGGHYVLTDEVRIRFADREILYIKGHALMDTSCCGPSGCAFVHVKGFVKDWKVTKNSEGLEITHLEPVADRGLQKIILEMIQAKEVFHQIQFD
jgi:molybdopterin synthase catalytic subunit